MIPQLSLFLPQLLPDKVTEQKTNSKATVKKKNGEWIPRIFC